MPKVDKAALLAELQAQLPDLDILHRSEDLKPYECDGLSAYRTTPLLVVLPERIEQVETLLALPSARRSGSRSRRRYRAVRRCAAAGAGHPAGHGALQQDYRSGPGRSFRPRPARCTQPGDLPGRGSFDLYYAPDPSSQIACSIGGNVAENAGGVHCLKYGLTVHNLLKVDILTVEGERMTLGSDALTRRASTCWRCSPAPKACSASSPKSRSNCCPPQVAKVLLAAFDSVEKAGRAVGDIIAAGIIPGGLEMMDNLSIRAAEDFIHAGYPVDAEAILLCELDGVEADVHDDCARVSEVLAGRRHRSAPGQGRSRARALLGGTQERLPGGRPYFAGLLLHGRHYSRRELPGVLKGISDLSEQFGCAWPTCSTPATATCTR